MKKLYALAALGSLLAAPALLATTAAEQSAAPAAAPVAAPAAPVEAPATVVAEQPKQEAPVAPDFKTKEEVAAWFKAENQKIDAKINELKKDKKANKEALKKARKEAGDLRKQAQAALEKLGVKGKRAQNKVLKGK